MKKPHMILASLLFVLPAAVMAQQPASKMTHEMSMSPASKEYMSGMQKMHSSMMNALKEQDADRAFAKGMIEHHRGAIAMAETELKYGKDPEMKKMAEDVIKAQKSEIEHMEAWLKK
ncbi:DUF305 domain-containing protein [Pantoea conspicua]|jgi:uncharacterized protein (DUF305 family)|uniref:DUF305 domain-containing protein n=3 Tax=Pantoea TaxID=53335 RepID=A0AAJ5QNJ4_9GAMM|nr:MULTISPECIES: DUF305 domain-containing protein [Pantoea]POW45753.1 DUF305 domain-containing protein [Pantoea alvi]KKD30346.1 hypothetical protein EP46_21495 [Pantoea sp. 3.5.1]MBB1228180.1 DUF305 domain-containing protein [Pantoea pleuroti]MCH9408190.1 DUF305 domain-containing protein [Pantoea agglomerans]MDF7787521.1 DUF305 domain-containing protein [Pantoea stewartii]